MVDSDKDALKKGKGTDEIVLCTTSDFKTEYKCFKCGRFVSCGSPAFRKVKKKICPGCLGLFKEGTMVFTIESTKRAGKKIQKLEKAKSIAG